MREVESDGFITREEDLMKSERTAKPMTECGYPRCEECDKCVDGYCTVPTVVSKQIYRYVTIELAELTVKVNELENIVYDEILGDDEDWVLTEDKYNELSPMQKFWYDKRIKDECRAIEIMNKIPKDDGGTIEIRTYAPLDGRYTPINAEEE